jgi:hypothetical protein
MKNLSTDSIRRISGAGAAHASWSMFGARGPLRSPEGDNAGGAGATTDTGAATTDTADKAAPAAAANVKTFTQADMDRIASKSRDEGRKAALKEKEQPKQETSPDVAGDKPLTMKDLRAELDTLKQRSDFDRRATKAGVEVDDLDDLFTLSQKHKPDDLDAWIGTKTKFLTGKGTMNNNNTGDPTVTVESTKPGAIAPKAPQKVDNIAANGMVDIFALTSEQIDQLGPAGLREKLEQVTAAAAARSGAPPLPKGMPQQKR